MRIIFASGSWDGGARRSVDQLAARLAERGHDVWLVVGQSRRRPAGQLHRRLVNLAVGRPDTTLGRLSAAVAPLIGRRLREERGTPVTTYRAMAPENAITGLAATLEPDVVVVSGLNLQPWRTVRAHLLRAGIPSVLYMREVAALRNLTGLKPTPPDLLLANAPSFVEAATAAGYPCDWVPSVVDHELARVDSTRHAALLVNPIASHGLDIGLAVADANPHIPVVLQESWPLRAADVRRLHRRIRSLPNVELRRARPTPRDVFADAGLLLAPHRLDNRPRVITEALASAIPVIVAGWPGLVDAAGPGGIVLDRDAPPEVWASTVEMVWGDAALLAQLGAAGQAWVDRDEVRAETVVTRFEELLHGLVAGAR